MMNDDKYNNTYIGIILSYQCNLNCKYCYIPEKKDLTIPLDVAQNILYPYLSKKDAEPIEIDFMGAEPLTAFERLKEIVEWAVGQNFSREFFFFATTNGTLLNDQMKQWFRENKSAIVLGLSYDGTDNAQNENRSGSSNRIDLEFFLKTWPEQAFKCTVSQHSVHDLANGIIRLGKMGAHIIANPAYENTEWSEEAIGEYGRQLKMIVDYYTDHPGVPVASLVNYDLIGIYYRKDLEQQPNCGASKGEGIYDVNGHSYPCQMLSPLVLSEEKTLEIQRIIKETDSSSYKDQKCAECILKNDCPTCMACNYLSRNDFALRDKTHCSLTRLEVLATCVLQKNRLLSKNDHDEYDAQMANAICEVYKSLQQFDTHLAKTPY